MDQLRGAGRLGAGLGGVACVQRGMGVCTSPHVGTAVVKREGQQGRWGQRACLPLARYLGPLIKGAFVLGRPGCR